MSVLMQSKTFTKAVVIFVLACFSCCVTSKIEYVEAEKMPPKEKTYRIADIFMKDGKVINLRDSESKFRITYKGKQNVITYNDDNYNTKVIELKDIDRLKIEVLESNAVVTVFMIIGIIAGIVLLAVLLAPLGFGSMH